MRRELEAGGERERALRLRGVLRITGGDGHPGDAGVARAGAIVDRAAGERELELERELEDVVLQLRAEEEALAQDGVLVLEHEVEERVGLVADRSGLTFGVGSMTSERGTMKSAFQPANGSSRHVPPTPMCLLRRTSSEATVRSSSRWFIMRDTAPRTARLGTGRS